MKDEIQEETPKSEVSKLSISTNNATGEIEIVSDMSMSRMQIRAVLTGALALIDSDMIAEAMAAKLAAAQKKAMEPARILRPKR